MRNSLIVIAVLLAGSMLLLPQAVQAQSKCQDFRGMSQWIAANGPYNGPIYVMLGDKFMISTSSQWVEFGTENCNNSTCKGQGGKLLISFGSTDTLLLEGQNFIYVPSYMPTPGTGTVQMTFKVFSGTGIFQKKTGLIIMAGPWAVWIDSAGFNGVFNGAISGTMCDANSK